MDGGYGVPRDIFAKMKIVGLLAWKLLVLGVSCIGGVLLGQHVFPSTQPLQMFAFMVLTPVIALYLVLPTNGGKSNWESLLNAIRRRKHRWISFDWTPDNK